MADGILTVLNQVKKTVGKPYKADKLDMQIAAAAKLIAEFGKNYASYKTAQATLEKAMLALQDTSSKYTNLLKQMDNGIAKETFGLDASKPDDKKTIDQCKKMIDAAVTDAIKINDVNTKNLDELDKHLDNLSDYKGPPQA